MDESDFELAFQQTSFYVERVDDAWSVCLKCVGELSRDRLAQENWTSAVRISPVVNAKRPAKSYLLAMA